MAVLRSAFIALSHNRSLRRFLEHSALGTRLSARFIAGLTLENALQVAESVNRQGISVTLDSLGESVTSEFEAHRAAEVYHQLLDAIAARKLDANISVKLTQMGLEVSPRLAESIAGILGQHAGQTAILCASTWKIRSARKPRWKLCGVYMHGRISAMPSA